MRAIGINDAVNTCDCCGRANLKNTVIMEMDDGTIQHYGCVCAARNAGKTQKVIKEEIEKFKADKIAAAKREYDATPEKLALEAKILLRPKNLIGHPAKEFIEPELTNDHVVRMRIVVAHGIEPWEI